MAKNLKQFPMDFVQDVPDRRFSELRELLSFVDFVRDVEGAKPRSLLFRGVGDADFRLLPSAFRFPGISELTRASHRRNSASGCDLENEQEALMNTDEYAALASFCNIADVAGIDLPPVPASVHDLIVLGYLSLSKEYSREMISDWPSADVRPLLALAQHYGVPTRLLDWSHSFETSLYFAIRSALDQPTIPSRFAIWVTSRAKLGLFSYASSAEGTLPYAVEIISPPYGKNPNLQAQQGCFTLVRPQGFLSCNRMSKFTTIDEAFRTNLQLLRTSEHTILRAIERHPFLNPTRVSLPSSEIPAAFAYLQKLGKTAATMFPGLEGCRRAMADSLAVRTFKDKIATENPNQ